MPNSKLRLTEIIMASTVLLFGCEKIPGADAYKIKIAQEVAARELIDPSSAQFRDLKVHDDVVCGEINAKNRMGAYVGFKRFFADTGAKTSSIDPQFDINELLSAQDFCRSVRSNAYSSYSLMKSACDRETEQTLAQLYQTVFDSGWALHCEGKPLPQTPAVTVADVVNNDMSSEEANATANMEMDERPETTTDDDGEYAEDEAPEVASPSNVVATNTATGPTQTDLDRIFSAPLPKREPSAPVTSNKSE